MTQIADTEFVLLTSFKRDGSGVATTVWIAPLGRDRACFTTSSTTWKVKRIRRTPKVTLQPCSRTGTPLPDTTAIPARATVHTDPQTIATVQAAVRSKYGWQARLLLGPVERIARWRGRRGSDVVVLLEFDA